jgi:hypothetical protein
MKHHRAASFLVVFFFIEVVEFVEAAWNCKYFFFIEVADND